MTDRLASSFVLVHGAWHGGWCWDELACKLRQRGFDVHAPTLAGLSHRPANRNIDADTHVHELVDLVLSLDLHRVTLVLHSYAGWLGGALLHALRPRLAQIALLEAVLPAAGKCLIDLLPAPLRQRHIKNVDRPGQGWLLPPPDVQQFDLPSPELARMLAGRLTAQPWRTFSEPLRSPQDDVLAFPGRYLLASDRLSQPYRDFARRASAAGWPVFTASGGHLLMLTNSDAVLGFLIGEDTKEGS